MLVTLFGIVMLVKHLHSRNAKSPMLVTLLGIVMLVRLLPENASSPIFVMLFGMEVLMQPETKVFVAVSMIALQLFRPQIASASWTPAQ